MNKSDAFSHRPFNRRSMLRGAVGSAAVSLLPKGFGEAGVPSLATARRPNIVWIMADQFRKQAVGFMGQDAVLTPNLDKLAAQGAAFTNAISTVPVCTPNRACLFTGKYALNTGMLCNEITLMPQHKTLGEYAKAAGYATAYFGKWHLGFRATADSGAQYAPPELRHGFDTWYMTQGIKPYEQTYFIGDNKLMTPVPGWAPDRMAATVTDYLGKQDAARPFCMVVSFGPPHNAIGKGYEGRFMPDKVELYRAWEKSGGRRPPATSGYAAPAPDEAPYVKGGSRYRRPLRPNAQDSPVIEESKCIQGYFGGVTAIDRAVGTIVDALAAQGLAENTIVLFTADHGESMSSHGLFAKDQFYQESCGIPLILRYPGKVAARRHDGIVNSIDLLPTVLATAGIPAGAMDGQDFSALLAGKPQKLREHAFGAFYQGTFTEPMEHFRSVYADNKTYAVNSGRYRERFGPEVLFDRTNDPYELKPIQRGMGRDRELAHFQDVLRAELKRIGDPYFADVWDPTQKGRTPSYAFYERMIAGARFPEQIASAPAVPDPGTK